MGNDHPSIVPYGMYVAKNDQNLIIGVGTDK